MMEINPNASQMSKMIRQNIINEIRGQVFSSTLPQSVIEDFKTRPSPFVIGYIFGYVLGRRTGLEVLSGKKLDEDVKDNLFNDVIVELFGEERGKKIIDNVQYLMMDYRWPGGVTAAAEDTIFALDTGGKPNKLNAYLKSGDD
jgi:hypothetical protein